MSPLIKKKPPSPAIIIKSGGEMASGVAVRLHKAGFRRIVMLETEKPLAVRRNVSFSEAVYAGSQVVENVRAVCCQEADAVPLAWRHGHIAVMVDPHWTIFRHLAADVSIDAILAKKNTGTRLTEAPLVIALGPGFTAGVDAHYVVETQRGHMLGCVYTQGCAEANTGIPGDIGGHTLARVLRAPVAGRVASCRAIGQMVAQGETVCEVDNIPVRAAISGVVRGCLRAGLHVAAGTKLGDIDPRGNRDYCNTISEKARSLSGAVLEVVCARFLQELTGA